MGFWLGVDPRTVSVVHPEAPQRQENPLKDPPHEVSSTWHQNLGKTTLLSLTWAPVPASKQCVQLSKHL